MIFYFVAGLCSAAAIIFLLLKFNMRRVLCFDILVDCAATAFLIIIFAGSFAGMMAAVIGGAIISITLFFVKRAIGHDRLTRRGWVHVPPRRKQWD